MGRVGDVLAGLIGLELEGNDVKRSPSRVIRWGVSFTTENTSKSGSTPRSVPLVALNRYLSNDARNDARSFVPFSPNGFSPETVVARSEFF